MLIHDTATAVTREKTREGYLRVRAKIGRSGLHDYKARDIGGPPGLPPDATVRVYRPPEAVFDRASMASFADVPVTSDHPPTMIDAGNWKHYAVGHVASDVTRDGDHLTTDLLVTDTAAVARAEAGAELSNGYWADFVFGHGMTAQGEPYDAIQQNIRGNHVALVDQGRCGPSCRIDAAPGSGTPTMPGFGSAAASGDARDAAPSGAPTLDCAGPACGCGQTASGDAGWNDERATVTIDGVAITTTVEGAAALTRLEAGLEQSRAAHARDNAARDAEITTLRAQLPDEAVLDGLLAERAGVVEAARRVLGPGFETRGRSSAALRRAAVTKVLGEARVRDRDDVYVAAAFDMLIAGGPPQRTALAESRPAANALAGHFAVGVTDGAAARETARAARDTYLTRAWKGASNGAP